MADGQEPQAPNTEQNAQAADAQQGEQLPDFVKDPAQAYNAIKELREENAKWRTQLQELKSWKDQQDQAAAEAKKNQTLASNDVNQIKALYEEQLQSLRNEVLTMQREQVRTTIASEFGLPPVLAARVKGDDAESMRQDAAALREALQSLIPPAQPTQQQPSGSGTPTAQPRSSTTPVPSGAQNAGMSNAQLRDILSGRTGRSWAG